MRMFCRHLKVLVPHRPGLYRREEGFSYKTSHVAESRSDAILNRSNMDILVSVLRIDGMLTLGAATWAN